MSSFSTAERRAALLFVQLIGELTERDGGDSEALLLASESVSSAFGVDADRDAASLNPSGARLLDILEEALAAVTEASAAKPTAEERIPLLATLRNSPKFNKYLEVVTSKGIFKGAEVGALFFRPARSCFELGCYFLGCNPPWVWRLVWLCTWSGACGRSLT